MCKCRSHGTFPPLRPSKFSFEYLLLPPRSAPTAAPPRLTPKVSAQFGTVTRLPVHPASPVLLTKNGPLGALDSVARLNEASRAVLPYLKTRTRAPAILRETSDGNQLLDGSISLSPLYPVRRTICTSVSLRPPPEFPLASPRSGHSSPSFGSRQACSHSNPSQKIKTPLVRVSRRAEWGAHRPVPGARRYIAETARAANHDRRDGISTSLSTARALAAAPIRTGPRPDPFHLSLAGNLFAIGLTPGYLALDGIYRPIGAAFPNNPPRRQRLVVRQGPGTTGLSPSLAPPFQGTWARSAAEDASPDYNSDSEAVRFSSRADPGSLAVTKGILANRTISTGRPNLRPDAMCPDKGCMVGGDAMRDAQAGVPSAGWLWAQLAFKNSMVHGILQFTPSIAFCYVLHRCVSRVIRCRESYMFTGRSAFAGFDNDPSAGSPTETLLRLLLPLNDKVQWNSRDVAGGEPPTSPRS
ncbi:hypothetical protein L1887_63567 [Cichorium endivia]|nr:hypothetical protein L1887_63567 [Cichorium endivia]